MPINYLALEDLVAINREVVRLSADPHGIINESNLIHLVESIGFKYVVTKMPSFSKRRSCWTT